MMRIYLFCSLFCLVACNAPLPDESISAAISIEDRLATLQDPDQSEVLVVAHRGDWRHAPENSLAAIENCIRMGVDMVEIDVRRTKDGELVLMHDVTIDRTTTGKGPVSDWTLDSLRQLQLLDGLGIPTQHRIPTLEEALTVCKDRILVNLDKSYNLFDQCFAVMEKTGTAGQVIIKGKKTRQEVEAEFSAYLDRVFFMPIIDLANPAAKEIIQDYLKNRTPVAFEFLLDDPSLASVDQFAAIREQGSSIWINALWPQLCGGFDDERAAMDLTTYDWYAQHEIDLIQTDRPALLLDYLRDKGLHR